jgi:hypothetical protein
MKWRVYFELGRVSNLPTVWTNTIAGITLASAAEGARFPSLGRVAGLVASFSLSYVGGMFLNDAFDRNIDARDKPERPIASGRIGAGEVFAIGFALLAAGIALVVLDVFALGGAGGVPAVLSAVALAGVIVLYDAWHKENPLGPVLMGACRVLVYVTAALAAAGHVGGEVLGGAAMLLAYLIGLTFLAKHEGQKAKALPSRWSGMWPLALLFLPFVLLLKTLALEPLPVLLFAAFLAWVIFTLQRLRSGARGAIPRAVVSLIAGISLLDANLIVARGQTNLALFAEIGFLLTLWLQRFVSGT